MRIQNVTIVAVIVLAATPMLMLTILSLLKISSAGASDSVVGIDESEANQSIDHALEKSTSIKDNSNNTIQELEGPLNRFVGQPYDVGLTAFADVEIKNNSEVFVQLRDALKSCSSTLGQLADVGTIVREMDPAWLTSPETGIERTSSDLEVLSGESQRLAELLGILRAARPSNDLNKIIDMVNTRRAELDKLAENVQFIHKNLSHLRAATNAFVSANESYRKANTSYQREFSRLKDATDTSQIATLLENLSSWRKDMSSAATMYDASAKELDLWKLKAEEPAPPVLITDLQSSARFQSQGIQLEYESQIQLSVKPDKLRWREVYDKITRFSSDFPVMPPSGDPLLQNRIGYYGDRMLAELRIEGLGIPDSTADLPQWLGSEAGGTDSAKSILDSFDFDFIKFRLKNTLVKWLDSQLLPKTTKTGKLEFTITAGGTLLEGAFVIKGGGAFYYFYEDVDEATKRNSNEYTEWDLNKLQGRPRKNPTADCVENYRVLCQELKKTITSERHWKDFREKCENYNMKVKEYEKIGGSVDLAESEYFDKELALANQVLEPANWYIIQSIVE